MGWRQALRGPRSTLPDDARRGPTARILGPVDLPQAQAVCALEPVAAVLASARIDVAVTAGLAAAGGQVWGFPAHGPLHAICWAGANLVPVVPRTLAATESADAVEAFAALARTQGRRSSSTVGERPVAHRLWELLSQTWPAPREVREDQPSLAIDRDPDIAPDEQVRRSVPREIDLLLPACVRMFTEEVGYSPVAGGDSAYASRVRGLIAQGHSFVRTGPGPDGAPRVEFKAELGAVSGSVAQVQGVWVDPDLRGTGLSAPGMAAVVIATRRDVAPVVSLYVNAFNTTALATYRRVGFEQVGTFTTVLF